jgi:hypothetical protein
LVGIALGPEGDKGPEAAHSGGNARAWACPLRPLRPRRPRRAAPLQGVAAAICMFGAVCALLLAGFLAHQLWLIGRGTTSIEAARLRELAEQRRRRDARRRKRGGRGGGGGSGGEGSDGSEGETDGGSSEGEGGGGGPRAPRRGPPLRPPPYHRGSVWRNFREVLLPHAFLAEHAAAAAGAGSRAGPGAGGGARAGRREGRGSAQRGQEVRRRAAAEQEA